jgi:hypothetical protein
MTAVEHQHLGVGVIPRRLTEELNFEEQRNDEKMQTLITLIWLLQNVRLYHPSSLILGS